MSSKFTKLGLRCGLAASAIFLSVPAIAVAADTTAPTAKVTSPLSGATVKGTIPFSATATDNVAVKGVTFRVDGVSPATDYTAPYTFQLNTANYADGKHTFSVRSFDTSGNTSVQPDSSVVVTIANATVPTPTPTPTPSPSPTPTPTPTPTSTTLFSESFDAAKCANNVWGTSPWTGGCARSEIQGDSQASIFYSVADAGRSTRVGSTESTTSQQRWWTYQGWTNPRVRVSVKEKPVGWDSGASSKSTWAGFTFYVRRRVGQSNSSFYGVSPYVYNGQRHIEKKCVASSIGSGTQSPFETGTMPDGEKYAYYLLANSSSGSQCLPSFGVWHDMSVTAENLSNGSVSLKVYVDGVVVQSAIDNVGRTGCAPLTAGGTGWRSDNHSYRLDDFKLSTF